MIKFIPIEKITEGLVISQDIISPSGQCLVNKGTVLTKSLIKSLTHHNITNLPIEDNLGNNDFTSEEIKHAEEIVNPEVLDRFSDKPADIMMKTIFKTSLRIEALEYLINKRKH